MEIWIRGHGGGSCDEYDVLILINHVCYAFMMRLFPARANFANLCKPVESGSEPPNYLGICDRRRLAIQFRLAPHRSDGYGAQVEGTQ